MILPKCINENCDNRVGHNGRRPRSECNNCHKASYGKKHYSLSVTPFRKGQCDNHNGNLGFPCPTDFKRAPWAKQFTEIDHINGNPYDNVPANCQELCPMCHKQKGKLAGDYKKQNKGDKDQKRTKRDRLDTPPEFKDHLIFQTDNGNTFSNIFSNKSDDTDDTDPTVQ